MHNTIITNAQILWDYHHVEHTIALSDIIFVLCSHDVRVASYAASLYLQGLAPYIVFSGGIAHKGDLIETPWETAEAIMFANIAIEAGVPESAILTEPVATNCGENVQFTETLLKEKGITFQTVLAVQKPYMERRTFATIKKLWPEVNLQVTSPPISFDNYPTKEIPIDTVINIMVGDLQRIIEYPTLGFQIYQEVPDAVYEAYEQLVNAGYTKHLINQNQ